MPSRGAPRRPPFPVFPYHRRNAPFEVAAGAAVSVSEYEASRAETQAAVQAATVCRDSPFYARRRSRAERWSAAFRDLMIGSTGRVVSGAAWCDSWGLVGHLPVDRRPRGVEQTVRAVALMHGKHRLERLWDLVMSFHGSSSRSRRSDGRQGQLVRVQLEDFSQRSGAETWAPTRGRTPTRRRQSCAGTPGEDERRSIELGTRPRCSKTG
jgi:hypothetical protein